MGIEAIDLAKRLIVDSIWKSANLEGLGTTFPRTENILNNLPDETSREEVLFILNMKEAWQFLLNNLGYPNCIVLVREYNKIIGDKLFYGNGKIRKTHVSIGGTNWSPGIPIEADITDNIKKIEEIEDIELKALKYFCYFARTQVFIDGNKRVAQLIANKVLISGNIGIFQIPINSIGRFKSLLLNYYETNDDSDIIAYMKSYCVYRVYTGFNSVENKPLAKKEIKELFKMSNTQVSIINTILYPLREYLFSSIRLTSALFYDASGVLTIESNGYIYGLNSGNSELDNLIRGCVNLLEEHIPLSIGSIQFLVSNRDLIGGEFKKSVRERGSVDLVLW